MSLPFYLSKLFKMFPMSFHPKIKGNELLNLHIPFPLASSCFMFKLKINQESLTINVAKMSVF